MEPTQESPGDTTLWMKRDVKRKYDEAKRRSQYPLHVVADKAIDAYLAILDREDAASSPDTTQAA